MVREIPFTSSCGVTLPLEEIKDEAISARDDDICLAGRNGAAAASQFASA
jgi:hypothetical protein